MVVIIIIIVIINSHELGLDGYVRPRLIVS